MEIKEIDVIADQDSQKKLAKHKKQKKNCETSAVDYFVRTDLLFLAPNAGKTVALEKLFEHYSEASVDVVEKLWQVVCAGETILGWRIVSANNHLHASSTLIQPGIAQARGSLSSHLGWLEKDIGKKISKFQLKLRFKYLKLSVKQIEEPLSKFDRLIHEQKAINHKPAECWKPDRHSELLMKVNGTLAPASTRSDAMASLLFGLSIKRRNPPDASRCQVELTRGGSKLYCDRLEISETAFEELGFSQEAADA